MVFATHSIRAASAKRRRSRSLEMALAAELAVAFPLGVVKAVRKAVLAIPVKPGRQREKCAISGRFGFATHSIDVASRPSAN